MRKFYTGRRRGRVALKISNNRRNSSKENSVICRVCSEKCLRQNYTRHLKRFHPEEDEENVREKRQRSVDSFFVPATVSVPVSSPTLQPESDESTSTNIVAEVDVVTGADAVTSAAEVADLEDDVSADETTDISFQQSILKNQIDIKAQLDLITSAVESLSLQSQRNKNADNRPIQTPEITADAQIIDDVAKCKTLEDIDNVTYLQYVPESGIIICTICNNVSDVGEIGGATKLGQFRVIDDDFGVTTDGNIANASFRNLKKHILSHLKSLTHLRNINVETSQTNPITPREVMVGMRIGRICYNLNKKGRPDTDFENEMLMHSLNGVDVGDINHSRLFPSKFIKYLSETVQSKVKVFLNSRLPQTGFPPAGKILADKATSKHRSKHFISYVTVVPGATALIQPILLDINIVKGHKGTDLANDIIQTLNKYDMNKEHYLGGSYDGQYHKLSVPLHIDQHYGFDGDDAKFSDWDPMHKAGVVDTHMRKNANFRWVNKATDTIGDAFKAINWGQEFEHFFEVAQRLKADDDFNSEVYCALPCFYSNTKFANHCSKVYLQAWKDYPALLSTFEETQMMLHSGSQNQRKKASEARALRNRMLNKRFAAIMCGLCDIYKLFGHGVNVLQTVNILPHERSINFVSFAKKWMRCQKTLGMIFAQVKNVNGLIFTNVSKK